MREEKIAEFRKQEKVLFDILEDENVDKNLAQLKERGWVRFQPKDERKRANDIFVAQFSQKDKDFEIKREKNRSNRALRAIFSEMDANEVRKPSEDSEHIDESNPEECESSSEPVELDEDVKVLEPE